MSALAQSGPPASGYSCTDQDFAAIAELVSRESGIFLTLEKKPLVVSRLSRRLRQTGLDDFAAYRALVENTEDGANERRNMIAELTTNVTRFLRERHHFQHFSREVLPELSRIAKSGGRVRLWSAGCSSGEEPFTLAMSLLDGIPDAARLDIKILATDIDPIILATARAARYDGSIIRPLPDIWREKYLDHHHDGTATMVQELRDLVTFRELNLMADWPVSVAFDVVFCRNVAIYFDRPTQARLWRRFHRQLRPGGHLYIGHSERLSREISDSFEPVDVTVFRRIISTPSPERTQQ